MSLSNAFIAELKSEIASTKKLLALVPPDKKDWTPHEKSMKLGRLATHVAELPIWVTNAIQKDELDFAKGYIAHPTFNSGDELAAQYDKNVNDAIAALHDVSDETMTEMWTLRNGETIYFTLPKKAIIRTFAINHFIHHRAQLGVYLRLLNIPIPGMYGPSADEKM